MASHAPVELGIRCEGETSGGVRSLLGPCQTGVKRTAPDCRAGHLTSRHTELKNPSGLGLSGMGHRRSGR